MSSSNLKILFFNFSKEVSLNSSDFNIIIMKPKKFHPISYRTEHNTSVWQYHTAEQKSIFSLRISRTFIYPNENRIYGRIYTSIQIFQMQRARLLTESMRANFKFLLKKCLRGVWNEEKSIVV